MYQTSRVSLPTEKTFDLNLKVNFESGRVSLALPTNFKKQPTSPYAYGTPIRQNICQPTNYLTTANSENSSQISSIESLGVVDCIICGRTYAQSQFETHIELHRKRNSQAVTSPINQNYPNNESRSKSAIESASDRVPQQSEYSFQPIQCRNVSPSRQVSSNSSVHSSGAPKFQQIQIGGNIPCRMAEQNSLSYSQQSNCYPESSYQQPSISHSHRSHYYRANSTPGFNQMASIRLQEFGQFEKPRVVFHNNTLPHGYVFHFQDQGPQMITEVNHPQRQNPHCHIQRTNSLSQESLSIRNIFPKEHYTSQQYMQREIYAQQEHPAENKISHKRSTYGSEISQSVPNSNEKLQKKMRQEKSIQMDKNKNYQLNSLYMGFKNQEEDSDDEENVFLSSKPILQRMVSQSFYPNKSLQLGHSKASQDSEKSSKGSKTKMPVNYLAREEFIESIGNRSEA